MMKHPDSSVRTSAFSFLWQLLARWLGRRREAELARIQEQLTQAQWQNSLEKNSHEADLASGYNLSHFNTMQ